MGGKVPLRISEWKEGVKKTYLGRGKNKVRVSSSFVLDLDEIMLPLFVTRATKTTITREERNL